MNIYTACMKSAAHIERRPEEFEFDSVVVPAGPGCGAPGCAIGWIIHFCGVRCAIFDNFTREHMGISNVIFYRRMNEFDKWEEDWMTNTRLCARNLRLYAQKYHAPVIAPPNWRVIMASPLIPEHVQSEEVAHD